MTDSQMAAWEAEHADELQEREEERREWEGYVDAPSMTLDEVEAIAADERAANLEGDSLFPAHVEDDAVDVPALDCNGKLSTRHAEFLLSHLVRTSRKDSQAGVYVRGLLRSFAGMFPELKRDDSDPFSGLAS